MVTFPLSPQRDFLWLQGVCWLCFAVVYSICVCVCVCVCGAVRMRQKHNAAGRRSWTPQGEEAGVQGSLVTWQLVLSLSITIPPTVDYRVWLQRPKLYNTIAPDDPS